MYVCLCRAVSDRKVAQLIREGARSAGEVARRCGAGTVCGSCMPDVRKMIYEQGYCGAEEPKGAKQRQQRAA